MRKRRVDSLGPANALKVDLYSEGGYLLHGAGERLTRGHIQSLLDADINWVVELAEGESTGRFMHEACHRAIDVGTLEAGATLSRAIYDSGGNLLLDIGHEITLKLRDRLVERGVKWVYIQKTPDERGAADVEKYHAMLRQMPEVESLLPNAELTPPVDRMILYPERELTLEAIEQRLSSGLIVEPEGRPFATLLSVLDETRIQSEHEREFFGAVYHDTVQETERLFGKIGHGQSAQGELIAETCRRIMRGLVKDSSLMLNVCNLRNKHEYLLAHSVRVTVIATAIGAALNYSPAQVYEVASGAFLHDIGMLRVPTDLVDKPGKLSSVEMFEIQKHPIYAIDLLQHVTAMPRTTPYVAYQSHEREDGSGYPRGRSGQMIHEFAKIIAVADIYDALTSKRPYRAPLLPYHAMEKVLQLASKRQVSPEIVRAFLAQVSLFPVGSWVELNDGRIGRVVAPNFSEYTRPVVTVFFNKNGISLRPQRVNLKLSLDLKVVAAVDPSDYPIEAVSGF